MMQKRTLHSLLIISFMVVFAASMSFANQVTVEDQPSLDRCNVASTSVYATVTADSVSGVECVFEITEGVPPDMIDALSITWQFDPGHMTDRHIDLTQADGNAPDTIRFAAMRLGATDTCLYTGVDQLIATIGFTTGDSCTGAVVLDTCTYDYSLPVGPIVTQFVDGGTGLILPVTVEPGDLAWDNHAPVIDAIVNYDHPWNVHFSCLATGDDADLYSSPGCEDLDFFKVSGPDSLEVAVGGAIDWDIVPPAAYACSNFVEVEVVDACGAADTTGFWICVTNVAPVIDTCAPDAEIFYGETYTGQVYASDADAGPNPLAYDIIGFGSLVGDPDPAVLPQVDNFGVVTWVTGLDCSYTGTWEIEVEVTDNACTSDCSPFNADSCSFVVVVRAMAVTIEKAEGPSGKGVIQGQPVDISIDMLDPALCAGVEIAGYDLLIAYDPTALSVITVTEGGWYTNCEWEYFTWRYGPYGNCGNQCPSGIIRIVAMANINDGCDNPNVCYDGDGSTQLAYITFLVTNDRTYECQYVPVRFIWYDCGDNTLSDVTGDTLMMSRWVFEYDCNGYIPALPLDDEFPTLTGATTECDGYYDKGEPVRWVDFYNGGVDIICGDEIDAVGDVNCNGIAYEIADAVMFTNYFINGLTAFGPAPDDHHNASMAASDANRDGIPVTVADLVYLIRVVVGDALPYPKAVEVKATYTHDAGVVAVAGDYEIAAVALEVTGDVTPNLLVSGMELAYQYDGANTRIIVYPNLEAATMASFTGRFLDGVDGEIVSIEMATREGAPVNAKNVPVRYDLSQNYPNPFNPTTTIGWAMPSAGAFDLVIYNIKGQVVDNFSGVAESAGHFSYEFDASDLASGVYLYKLTASDFTSVKKMVFLK